MSWRTILKLEDDYMVRSSVWIEAGKGGVGYILDGIEEETHDFSTQKELEEALSRPLKAEDYMFIKANWMKDDVKDHLGDAEFKRMMNLFKNKEYQIDTREGGFAGAWHMRVNRKDFKEKYKQLYGE